MKSINGLDWMETEKSLDRGYYYPLTALLQSVSFVFETGVRLRTRKGEGRDE